MVLFCNDIFHWLGTNLQPAVSYMDQLENLQNKAIALHLSRANPKSNFMIFHNFIPITGTFGNNISPFHGDMQVMWDKQTNAG